MRKRFTLIGLVIAALVAMFGFTATSASATTNPCGSGYSQIGSAYAKSNLGNTVQETVTYYSSTTGDDCLINYNVGKWYGVAVNNCAAIELSTWTWTGWEYEDCGTYKYYAGPVYVHAPHACIDGMGHTNNSNDSEYATYRYSNAYCS